MNHNKKTKVFDPFTKPASFVFYKACTFDQPLGAACKDPLGVHSLHTYGKTSMGGRGLQLQKKLRWNAPSKENKTKDNLQPVDTRKMTWTSNSSTAAWPEYFPWPG
jgi:hypothetical protein